MKKKLVLFDFDGTITTRDSFAEFLIFYKGKMKFLLGVMILSPVIALYILKLIPNWRGKQIVLRWFWGGADVQEFNARCREFSTQALPRIIRPQALAVIREYLKSPDTTVAVVSASAENWIGPWCEAMGVKCIATQLDTVDGKLTGNICGANCYGPEKVKRIEQLFKLADYDEIVAYGDSAGDREMFAIAHQHHYKPFRIQAIETTGA
jgi:HAD superfamily hydrolase (TIGR01490 family)